MRRLTDKGKNKRKIKKRNSGLFTRIIVPALVISVLLGGWRLWKSDAVQMRFVYMWDYQQDIITYSDKNNIDPFLVAAIIKNESNFDHKALSNEGAVGLMQIMPETGRWIAESMGLKDYTSDDLFLSRNNIRMGCWYVSELEHEFKGNLVLMLIAYNAGRGKTRQWIEENGWDYNFNAARSIPYPDTKLYVIKVLRDRDEYYRLYKDVVRAERVFIK